MAKDPEKWCPEVGQILGDRLVIQREVGRGLHGVSYLAQNNTDQSLVRIKVLNPEYFKKEQQSDDNLFLVRRTLAYRDAAIAQINDVLQLSDTVALVSSWISGKTLAEELRDRAKADKLIQPMELLPIITDVVTGLRWIHRFGAHANLRPENVLLSENGNFLLDPYALKIGTDIEHLEDLARHKEARNHYRAPERRHETGRDDPRSDIFALAKIMGYALTGSLVPSGASLKEHGGGAITKELDDLYEQATREDPSQRISLDEFFRVIGAGLTEASERRVGFQRSENITLASGLPAMTDELLEAVEAEKRKREEKARAAAGQQDEIREGFWTPSLGPNEGVASQGTILHGASLPSEQNALIEEAVEEVLKKRVVLGGAEAEHEPAPSDSVPEMSEPSSDVVTDEAAEKSAQESAQQGVVSSVRESMDETKAADDEFTVDLEEILDEMDTIETDVTVPAPPEESQEPKADPDSTIEIGIDFDFEELPKDATPAPEEIEIEVIAEADLLLEDIGAEEQEEHDLSYEVESDEAEAVELKASDLEVESITPEVAQEIATQVQVQTLGDISDSQKPYGGVDTDRITLPKSGQSRTNKETPKSYTTAALIGSGLLVVLIVLFVNVINASKDRSDNNTDQDRGGEPSQPNVVLVSSDTKSTASDTSTQSDTKPTQTAKASSSDRDAVADQAKSPSSPDTNGTKAEVAKIPPADVAVVATKDVQASAPDGTKPPVNAENTPDAKSGEPTSKDASAASAPPTVQPVSACPPSYVSVPGKDEIPAFCMQTHEYPGAGMKPKVKVNLSEARELCGEVGARLCRKDEFPLACDGRYPYGPRFKRSRCNVAGEFFDEKRVRKSGDKKKCVSKLGVFDLSGNVGEWVEEGLIAGGSSAESGREVACTKFKKSKATRRLSKVGFRCCLTLQP